MSHRLPPRPVRPFALGLLALAAAMPARAADAAAPRHCVLLAAEYETRGTSDTNVADALRANVRPIQARMLEHLQADRLVANTVFIDVDSRFVAAERLGAIRKTTGCDTVVELRAVFVSATFGGAFGFDVAVSRDDGGASAASHLQQYRYGVDKATLAAFSNAGFADLAWAELRRAVPLDADREARTIEPAAVRAEYDRLAAAWPRTLPEYHLRQIVREQEPEASAMIARLHDQDPPDFARLAADSSIDKASADKGGDIGWMTLQVLPGDVASAIRAQQGRPGLLVRPLQADDGWHVVEVLGSRPSQAPPFDKVSDRLAASMRWTAVVPQATWALALRQQ